jgi:hypothetical protein
MEIEEHAAISSHADCEHPLPKPIQPHCITPNSTLSDNPKKEGEKWFAIFCV